jgi:glycosyltransferase involved in cell wall biosynthesis
MMRHPALYAAFDRVPTAKGASVHIAHAVRALERTMGGALLFCLGDGRLPQREREAGLEVLRFEGGPELVERVLAYQRALAATIQVQGQSLRLCHFRDPWSGIPILEARGRFKTVYEVNGLPSIELPYRFPKLAARTLERVREMEQRCLEESDFILTPSETLARNLQRRGVDARRITVIPNGASLDGGVPRPPASPEHYFIYFGALQPWQGVRLAIDALARLEDLPVTLVICSSHPPRIGLALKARAQRLGVADRILWQHELSREALAPWIAHAIASLAPLAESARNIEQGCCPLKILESMAAGTPVIASDLAPVRELMAHGEHGLLVRPGRAELFARGMRELMDEPARREAMGRRARDRVREHYTWDAIEARTERWYRETVLS